MVNERTDRPEDGEKLWIEHGWGLRGLHVAMLVSVIVVASVVVQLIR